jgi:histidinol-phosphatase (PHP family)
VEVLVALEFDYWPGVDAALEALWELYPWDLRLGSVHYVGDFGIDSEEEIPRWEKSDPDVVWEDYFALLTEAAGSGLFDVIGHADLVKKFNFYPRRDPTPWYEAFLSAAAASGVVMELNTGGLRKPCAEVYPGVDILRLARAYEVPIAFGSDGHHAGQIAAGFETALALARSAGYEQYVRFHPGREREVFPLPGVL